MKRNTVDYATKNNVPRRNYYLGKAGLEFIANEFGFSLKQESTVMAKISFS